MNQYFARVPKAAKPVPRDIPQEPQHTKERRVTLEQPGIFSAVALVNPGKSPADVEKALIAEFDSLKTQGITERELQRAKNQFSRDYIVSRLSIKEKASQLGHAEVIQKDITTADGEFDTFQKVSLEDVKRVAQKYFVPEGRLVMRIMPRGGAAK